MLVRCGVLVMEVVYEGFIRWVDSSCHVKFISLAEAEVGYQVQDFGVEEYLDILEDYGILGTLVEDYGDYNFRNILVILSIVNRDFNPCNA